MTTTEQGSLEKAISEHHTESKRLGQELRKHAADLADPTRRRQAETLLRAHEAMSDWFHDDALGCVSPTGK